tara:strand:- start:246 stop:536 length:291 start_codon:yes stop_codon:yes gene_type:complete
MKTEQAQLVADAMEEAAAVIRAEGKEGCVWFNDGPDETQIKCRQTPGGAFEWITFHNHARLSSRNTVLRVLRDKITLTRDTLMSSEIDLPKTIWEF